MKARIHLDKNQKAEAKAISLQYVLEGIKEAQLDQDALWLMALHEEFDFGAVRLKRFYERVYRLREEYLEFTEDSGYDGYAACAARQFLEAATGLSIESLHKDLPFLIKADFDDIKPIERWKLKRDGLL